MRRSCFDPGRDPKVCAAPKDDPRGFGQGFLGLLGIATGLTVAAVFLLTNPPAFDELSTDSLAIIGGVVLIVLCGLGLNEVTEFLSMGNRRGRP